MSKILYINKNNFHHLGTSQMCAGGCYVFRTSKPHSGTLCALITARHHLTCNQPTVKQETAQEYQTNSFLSYTIYFSIKLAYNFLSQWHCLDPFPPLVSGVYNAHLHTTHLAIWDHKRIWTTNIKMYLRD